MAVQLDEIRKAAERAAATLGLEVVDVEFAGAAKARTLRVYVEKNAAERARLAATAEALPENVPVEQLSGVTHEDCEAFARDFGTLLDVEDLVPGAEYMLEVSSPGLDRRLRSAADFERFVGSRVKLQTFTAVNGNRHWNGRLTTAANGRLTLDISAVKQKGKAARAAAKGAEAKLVELELANVEKANLVPEI